MDILIVGLGLMGASYSKGLKAKGHTIYGVDTNINTVEYAISNKIVDYASLDVRDFFDKVELIILGLYPNDILPFLKEYKKYFTSKHLITDLCGVKSFFIHDVFEYINDARYVTHHPMAGREKVGIQYSNPDIFRNMNFLICPTKESNENDIEIIRKIGLDLDFGRITIVDSNTHDQMIAYTSQLTHLIAVGLVNSLTDEKTKSFIGDSYKDLTRIAMINENLWSQLFFNNKDNLINNLDSFLLEVNKIKEALEENDYEELENIFKKSKNIRGSLE